MIGQRGAIVRPPGGRLRSALIRLWRVFLRRGGGFDLGIFLQVESQLVCALGFGAEPCLAAGRQLPLKVFDHQKFTDHPQFSRVFWQGSERIQHG